MKVITAATIPVVMPSKNIVRTKREAVPPNVIIIITDDQGYGDLSCHGNPILKTPNLDRLFSESVRLSNFHVDPTCSPTRASLLTGRYSSRAGVWHTIMGRSLLRGDEMTMADIFTQNGYITGIFGKWHLGDNYPYRPEYRGFHEVLTFGGGAIGNAPDFWQNDYFDDTYYHNGKWEKFKGYCTDIFFSEAIEFIRKANRQPFFVYLPTNTPHWPHNVNEKYVEAYRNIVPEKRATFYGMISNIDENIGRLLKFLEANRLSENTIIIFLTDNGTSFGAEFDNFGFITDGFNAGMRGGKGSVYEGGHHVPCFIRWPAAGFQEGSDLSVLTAHIDLLPTLIDLCNLKTPENISFDGSSIRPLLAGAMKSWPERTIFVHNQRVDYPIKWKDYVVMKSNWRLVNGTELYDIYRDPEQRRNLADDHANLVKSLRQSYEQWWEEISSRFSEYCPIVIGSDKENPVKLTSHDIHGQVAWDQRHVFRNSRCDGFWVVEVSREGYYDISVRRWPEETDLPISAAPQGGVAIKPTHARLKIADFDLIKPVDTLDKAITFRVPLRTGKTWLQAWLIDGRENGESNGAFYVYINFLK